MPYETKRKQCPRVSARAPSFFVVPLFANHRLGMRAKNVALYGACAGAAGGGGGAGATTTAGGAAETKLREGGQGIGRQLLLSRGTQVMRSIAYDARSIVRNLFRNAPLFFFGGGNCSKFARDTPL